MRNLSWRIWSLGAVTAFVAASSAILSAQPQTKPAKPGAPTFANAVVPTVKKYCAGCHSSGKLPNLVKDKTAAQAKKNAHVWEEAYEEVSRKKMPPKGMPAPNATERARMLKALKAMFPVDDK